MTVEHVAGLLRSINLLVLKLELPKDDSGPDHLLVGEEDWSCSVLVEDNDNIVLFEGPNVDKRFQVRTLVQGGLRYVRSVFRSEVMKNTRFKDIRNSHPDLSDIVDYLTDNRVKRSVIVG